MPALRALPPEVTWTLGGGTALALTLNHRVSYDIDVFFETASALRLLSPQRNALVRALSDRWQEPGNYLKIEGADGDIDILVAMTLTEEATRSFMLDGQAVAVETPAEILAKKFRYRGSMFQVRDIFDALAIVDGSPTDFAQAVRADPGGARRARDRIARIAPRYREEIGEAVNPTETGAALLDRDPMTVVDAITRSLNA
ncbi:nucleotidyl transferase AbiEii/AbiGii toxin family protein [Roseospira navarrensis]|uniref:Nucleotidyl transferase AbiEii/AbiGii toxin family protein n=1 Tax=Roseospira navarrensis TaxID=140058 RepID=A0A7X1ZD05_9PROT|nr:nucleotidyl transferase AbiEii/AbiGii toxin family protein [Roseospira navarrensis]MQX36072.1 hypothetical protein [Roseospira navarrensis]